MRSSSNLNKLYMKIVFKNLILSAITVLISVLIVTAVVNATIGGPLNPPASAFDHNNNPQGTMHTLDNIYNKLLQSSNLFWQQDPNLTLCQNASPATGCTSGNGLLDPTGNGAPLLGAVEYCNYLEADGTTIGETPQNIWRLPTIGELMEGLTDQYMVFPAIVSEFADNNYYWSSTLDVGTQGNAQFAYDGTPGDVYGSSAVENDNISVRCVRKLPPTPLTAICGDGIVETGETCDTGNNTDLGCVNCQTTSGYTCISSPSVCKFSAGQTCSNDFDCNSGMCNSINNTCTNGYLAGASCVNNYDCGGNVCADGICQGIDYGNSCSKSYQCETNYCNYRTCGHDYSDGQPCLNGYDCVGGECGSGNNTCTTPD